MHSTENTWENVGILFHKLMITVRHCHTFICRPMRRVDSPESATSQFIWVVSSSWQEVESKTICKQRRALLNYKHNIGLDAKAHGELTDRLHDVAHKINTTEDCTD